MSSQHVFSASAGLDADGRPQVRARCSCGWSEVIIGAWPDRHSAENDARMLFNAHLLEENE